MLSFSLYLTEKEKKNLGGLSTNEAGKLHEVLLGGLVHHYAQEYQKNKHLGHDKAHELALSSINKLKNVRGSHLYDITHMPQFKDVDNKTAKELHDEFGSKLSLEDYHESYQHALHGASALIDHLHQNGIKDIRGVHFTANKNDINRLSGYENVKDEGNNSDIVVEHGHKGRYYGVSLKSGVSSKLNNPGMGTVRNLIDDYYQKITGKKSNFGNDSVAADNAAREAHENILNDHLDLLNKHFGENGVSSKNGLTIENGKPVLNKDAFRFLEKADEVRNKKEKYAKMYRSPEERAQLRDLYFKLRDSRTDISKRRTNESLAKHLKGIISQQSDPNKHGLIKEFMSKFYNVKRPEEAMPVVRLNTFKNSEGAIRKGAPQRTSKISTAKDDFENGFNNSVGKYEVKSNPGTINTTISSPYGHNSNLVVDSSPAAGRTAVTRNGVHVWDKTEKVPTSDKRTREKKSITPPSEPVAPTPQRTRLSYRRSGTGRVPQTSGFRPNPSISTIGTVWPHGKGND